MPVNERVLRARRQQALEALRTSSAAQLGRIWRSLPEYTPATQRRWERLAAPVVTAAQNRAVDTQLAYLTVLLGRFSFDRKAVLAQAVIDLRIPFITLAKTLTAGGSFDTAVNAGAVRAAGLGPTGVTWAARAANTAVEGEGRIVGWERIPSGNACAWCLLVATQIYKTVDSASFGHARAPCHCDVDPIFAA